MDTMKEYLFWRKILIAEAFRRMPTRFTTRIFRDEMERTEADFNVEIETPMKTMFDEFRGVYTEGGHRAWSFDRPRVALKTMQRQGRIELKVIGNVFFWKKKEAI